MCWPLMPTISGPQSGPDVPAACGPSADSRRRSPPAGNPAGLMPPGSIRAVPRIADLILPRATGINRILRRRERTGASGTSAGNRFRTQTAKNNGSSRIGPPMASRHPGPGRGHRQQIGLVTAPEQANGVSADAAGRSVLTCDGPAARVLRAPAAGAR